MTGEQETMLAGLVRERVTWLKSDRASGRRSIAHPWQWRVTEPDGYARWFDTRREAAAWIDTYA